MRHKFSTRVTIAVVVLTVALIASPAMASLLITTYSSGRTELADGPRFYAYGTGTAAAIGVPTAFDGFTLDGVAVDPDAGLVLARSGDVAPSAQLWWDQDWSTRACATIAAEAPVSPPPAEPPPEEPPPEPASPRLAAISFDTQTEFTAGRLTPDLRDLRLIDSGSGLAIPHRVVGEYPGSATQILVDITTDETLLCAYWGNAAAETTEDTTLEPDIVADGTWSWDRWDTTGDGLSLDLVDWSVPSASDVVLSSAGPVDVCDRCATELAGFVVPAVTGSYTFFLSASAVGTLELAPTGDPAGLAEVVNLGAETALDDFSDPSQASVAVDLEADVSYAIRARSKSLIGAEHLQIAWAIDDGPLALVDPANFADANGVPGQLTYHRFDSVETIDVSTPPTETLTVTASEIIADSCDVCQHRLGGYLLVETAGTYRFWLSSDDEGTLRLSASGDPTSPGIVASTPTFTNPSTWDTFSSQQSQTFELVAEQVVWLEATSREAGGPDHLQVGWSTITGELDPDTGEAVPETVSLLPTAQLSSSVPAPEPVPTVPVGSTEGLFVGSGSFVSPIVDTTEDGTNIHGIVELVSATQPAGTLVSIQLAYAATPDGPWVASGPESDVGGTFQSGDPVPLAFDGLRYWRVEGSLTTTDLEVSSTFSEIRVEHDLNQFSSADATSTVSAAGVGRTHLVRVRGTSSTGVVATIEVLPGGVLTGFTGSTWLATPETSQVVVVDGAVTQGVGADLLFGSGNPLRIGLSVDAVSAPVTLRVRWVGTSAGGALISHDFVVSVEP